MGVNLSIIANSIENQNILYSRMYWEKKKYCVSHVWKPRQQELLTARRFVLHSEAYTRPVASNKKVSQFYIERKLSKNSNIQQTYRVDLEKRRVTNELDNESSKYDGERLESYSFKEIYPFYTLWELFLN